MIQLSTMYLQHNMLPNFKEIQFLFFNSIFNNKDEHLYLWIAIGVL
jgi:hypothetical protein